MPLLLTFRRLPDIVCIAIYQLQNFNQKEKLERAFFGLVSDKEAILQRLRILLLVLVYFRLGRKE